MNKYANIGSRFLAYLIDTLVISVVNFVITYTYFELTGFNFRALFGPFGRPYYRALWAFDYFPIYILLILFVTIMYFALFESSDRGGTIGKMILGIRVVDGNDRRIGFGTSFVRSVGRIISGILFIGYIIAFASDEGQSLHDKMAGTYVINAKYAHTEMMIDRRRNQTVQHHTVAAPRIPQNQPKVIGISGELAGMSFLVDGRGVMIGRDPSCCNAVLNKDTKGISRHHCIISYNPQTNMFVLKDCGSSCGTFTASGMRVPNGQPVALRSGERFYLASVSNMFEVRN